MTIQQTLALIAQGVINIAEGITTIEPDSPIHKAMSTLCDKIHSEEWVLFNDSKETGR